MEPQLLGVSTSSASAPCGGEAHKGMQANSKIKVPAAYLIYAACDRCLSAHPACTLARSSVAVMAACSTARSAQARDTSLCWDLTNHQIPSLASEGELCCNL